MKRQTILLLASLIISGCSSIEHTSSIDQPVNQAAIVGVGDVVLRINKQRNLENAFGKADMFGRKTNEGFSELVFAGVEPSGEIVLYRQDVNIITNETTLSRTPFSSSTGSSKTNVTGSYYGNRSFSGNSTTNYSSTSINPSSDFHSVVPAGAIPIRLAPNENKLPMGGYMIEVIKATPNSFEYKIIKH
ncbi:hypothetical protein ACI2KR_06655 [Pseudomonas luteola]